MTIYVYEQLESNIKDLASKRAIISENSGGDLFRIRIQPTDLIKSEISKVLMVQLYSRVSIGTGGESASLNVHKFSQ